MWRDRIKMRQRTFLALLSSTKFELPKHAESDIFETILKKCHAFTHTWTQNRPHFFQDLIERAPPGGVCFYDRFNP